MNWKSKSVSEVSKEKIWKEHVLGETSHRKLNENFRVNPLKLLQEKPLPESIVKRGKRFLDRDAAFLETMARRGYGQSMSGSQTARGPSSSETPHFPAINPQNAALTPRVSVPRPPSRRKSSDLQESSDLQLAPVSPRVPHPPSGPATARGTGNTQPTAEHFANFHNLLVSAGKTPVDKYSFPLTESQELGWLNRPLVSSGRSDRRFRFNIKNSEMTKYASSLAAAKQLQKAK